MTHGDMKLLHDIVVPWWQEYTHFMRLWFLVAAAISCFAISVLVWIEDE